MRAAILIALAVAHVGCIDDSCTESRLRALEIVLPTDAPMQFQIDRCQLDDSVCVEVCRLAAERSGFSDNVTRCSVDVQPTLAKMIERYEVFVGGGFCGVQGDDIGTPPPRHNSDF